jgi:hypothetical protein
MPANTPQVNIDKINKEINAAFADPRIRASPRPGRHHPRRFGGRFRRLSLTKPRNGQAVIRAANIKAE